MLYLEVSPWISNMTCQFVPWVPFHPLPSGLFGGMGGKRGFGVLFCRSPSSKGRH